MAEQSQEPPSPCQCAAGGDLSRRLVPTIQRGWHRYVHIDKRAMQKRSPTPFSCKRRLNLGSDLALIA